MQYKRPKCDYCGTKLLLLDRKYKALKEIPSYCQYCGKEISNQKRAQLDTFYTLRCCLGCSLGTLFIFTIIMVFGVYG